MKSDQFAKMLVIMLVLLIFILIFVAICFPKQSFGESLAPPDSTAKFNSLLEKYFKAPPGSRERVGLVKEMSVFSLRHKQWLGIYNNPRTGSELNLMVLDKLIETCETIEDCDRLWSQIMGDHEVVKKLFNKIINMPQTLHQLFSLYKRIYLYDNGMESKVRRAIVEGWWANPEEILAVYFFAVENSLTRFEVELVDEMKTMDKPFEFWADMASSSPRDSRLRELGVEKMLKKAEKFEDAHATWKLVQDTDEEDDTLKLMFRMSQTFAQKLVVLGCSISGSKIEKQIFNQLLNMADSKEKLKELSRRTSPGSKFAKIVEEKMKNLSQ